MKTIRYISIFIIAVFLSITSCEKDDKFLEENPKSLYALANAFEKSSQVKAQLTMCYLNMYGFYDNNGWWSPFMYKNTGTDVLDQPYWQTGGSGGYSNFGSTWSSTSGFVNSVWTSLYQTIAYANATIKGTEVETITWVDESEKNELKAQARFFRGLAYLRLGELYGGVPINLEILEEVKLDYVRATRQETFQQAIDDLLAAYNDLPDYPSEIGRIGKGAPATMLAEAYLAQGVETGDNANYTSAITYATAAINLHPLMYSRFGVRNDPTDLSSNRGEPTYKPDGNVFSDLFCKGNFSAAENTEAIWVLQTPTYEQYDAYRGPRNRAGWMFTPALRDLNWATGFAEPGSAAGPWKSIDPPYNTASFPAMFGGFGISQVMTTDFASYDVWDDPSDLRYEEDVTVRVLYECSDANHSMFGQKVPISMLDQNPNVFSKYCPLFAKLIPLDEWPYRDTDNMHQSANHDVYGIRSAEAYLLRAEAYLRSNQLDLAADDINELRTRAQCTNYYDSGDMDIDLILDERVRELLYEEGRWFTLLRIDPAVWKQRLYDHAMYIDTYPNYTIEIPFELWPIPNDIIEINTGAEIIQNDGW